MKKQRKWKPYSGRILSSLLALCLLIGMLPTAALAAEDEPQDGGAPIVCTELEGCTEDTHDESCPLYVKPSAPPAEEPTESGEGSSAEERLSELVAALPALTDISPEDEGQIEAVYNHITDIYTFSDENGLTLTNEQEIVIERILTVLYSTDTFSESMPEGTWIEAVTECPNGYTADEENKKVTISSSEGMAWFAKQLQTNAYTGYSVSLESDINLSAHYWASWNNTYAFSGEFNGNGHTISNLYISATSSWQGLFPIIKNGGAIKNLKVSQIDISAEEGYVVDTCGVISPQLQDGTITNCSISNGTVTVRSGVGGIVGSTILDTGGIISYCSVSDFTFNLSGNSNIRGGGIAGELRQGNIYTNCFVYDVTFCLTNSVSSRSFDVGGIAGFNLGGSIEQCCVLNFSASVNAENPVMNIGSVVGNYNSGSIMRCYAEAHETYSPIGAGAETDVTTLSANQFKDASNFPALDFDNIWSIDGAQGLVLQAKTGFPTVFYAEKLKIMDGDTVIGGYDGTGSAVAQELSISIPMNCGSVAISAAASTGATLTGLPATVEFESLDTVKSCTFQITYPGETVKIFRITLNRPKVLSGEGTDQSPILVSNLEDLEVLSENISQRNIPNAFISFTADIDCLGKSITPVPAVMNVQGNQHTISNFIISDEYTQGSGLFKTLEESGKITGLYLDNAYLNGGPNSGVLVGTISENAKVTKCAVTNSAFLGGIGHYSGLIFGKNSGSISQCYSTGDTRNAGPNIMTGGLGGTNAGTIKNCYSDVYVTGNNSGNDKGPFVWTNESGMIENCIWNAEKVTNCFSIGPASHSTRQGTVRNSAGVDAKGGSFTQEAVFKATAIPLPTKTGYVFDGWYDNAELTGTPATTVSADSTYYAKWLITGGFCGDPAVNEGRNVTWALTKNGTVTVDGEEKTAYALTISGNGAMADYSDQKDNPWCIALPDNAYQDQITKIVIGAGITKLGSCAFLWCKNVSAVEFEGGSRLREIGLNGFHSMAKLTEITFPAQLEVIGEAAFYSCSTLETVTFENPDILTAIGKSAFGACSKLVYFNNTEKSDAKELLPQSLTEIGPNAFQNCSNMIGQITIPSAVEELTGSFWGCAKLSKITFANNSRLTKLGANTFNGCKGITEIELPSELTSIGTSAFSNVPITSIVIPSQVTEIGDSAFSSSTKDANTIANVVFSENSQIKKIGNNSFKFSLITSISLPEGLEELGNSVFQQSTITAITIPSTVKKIGTNMFHDHRLATINMSALTDDAEFTGCLGSLAHGTVVYLASEAAKIKLAHNDTNYGQLVYAITNGGVVPAGEFTTEALNAPVREGYTFDGWYVNADFSGPKLSGAPQNATAYYAKWTLGKPEVEVTASASSITSSQSAILTAAAIHELEGVTYEYQWYTGTPDSGSAISGATSQTYTVSSLTSDSTYYCKVTAVNGADKSDSVSSTGVTITKATNTGNVTITSPAEDAKTAAYGGAAFDVVYTVSDNKTATVTSSNEKVATVSGDTVTIVGAGTTTITATFAGNANYSTASDSFTLTVNKAVLTATYAGETIYVGGTPALKVTVTGFVNNETAGTAAGYTAPSVKNSHTAAGSYTLTPSGGSATNYDFNYVGGTLTIRTHSSSSGGSTTETTTNPDGSTLVVETMADGTVITTETRADGVKVKTVDEPGRDVTAEVTIPQNVGGTTVTIPADVDYGMVARDEDTGELIKLSFPTGDGMLVKLEGSAELVLVNNAKDFSDTTGHWAQDAIDFVTARGLFGGISETSFAPDSPMTRAMLMTVLARFDGQDTEGGAVWYEKGMEWAVANSVSDGSNPNHAVTREQTAAMLWRYAGCPAAEGSLSGFMDAGSTSEYAVDAICWTVSAGIIGGTGTGVLAPQDNAARAQVAAILMRFVENLVK